MTKRLLFQRNLAQLRSAVLVIAEEFFPKTISRWVILQLFSCDAKRTCAPLYKAPRRA